jgi:hypothetical protein
MTKRRKHPRAGREQAGGRHQDGSRKVIDICVPCECRARHLSPPAGRGRPPERSVATRRRAGAGDLSRCVVRIWGRLHEPETCGDHRQTRKSACGIASAPALLEDTNSSARSRLDPTSSISFAASDVSSSRSMAANTQLISATAYATNALPITTIACCGFGITTSPVTSMACWRPSHWPWTQTVERIQTRTSNAISPQFATKIGSVSSVQAVESAPHPTALASLRRSTSPRKRREVGECGTAPHQMYRNALWLRTTGMEAAP